MESVQARKPTYSAYVKLESYVLTIHLGERDSDLQSPNCLVIHPSLVGLRLVLLPQ